MYNVKFDKKVDKFLSQHWDYVDLFFKKVDIIRNNPYKNNLDIKSYHWRNNSYRLRIGKYRFLYEIIEKEILIYFFDADKRWDVYK
jgi:mRNA interferase RelE/StbE